MAKDPAFLFYPNDWLGGTLGMSFEEKGAYMELLMLQFNRGHMTEHMCGQLVGQLWIKIREKFTQDPDGLYYNERLEQEKIKRQNYTKSRRNNVSGENQHTKKENKSPKNRGHMTTHMTGHMENENENENTDLNNKKGVAEKKQVFGEFKNVTLLLIELERLNNDLGVDLVNACINYLSSYKAEKGYKTKSDNLTIRRWVKDAVLEKKNKGPFDGESKVAKNIKAGLTAAENLKLKYQNEENSGH